jgi:hypothetical protein
MDVMVKCGVLFEVRTEYLDIIQTRFGFKELICILTTQRIYGFYMTSRKTAIIFLNSLNQLIFVMVTCAFFEVRTECLNI